MSISEELKSTHFEIFSNHISKTNAKKILKSLESFTINYTEINETPWLAEDIFLTKSNELVDLLKKNNFLKDNIKKKIIDPENICNMLAEELDPEKYESIIYRKELEEFKKNNKSYSTAFTCKKCKSNKSEISERQTRSGDEPTTIYITCAECGYSFSF